MLGVRPAQRGLLEADHLYLDYVGRGSFYGFLASLRGQLFRDEDFAELYCPDNGRDSVPPSLVATALLLQTYDKVSDLEAKQRADSNTEEGMEFRVKGFSPRAICYPIGYHAHMDTRKRPCDTCGNEYTANRSDSKYCKPYCKLKAFKRRRGISQDQAERDLRAILGHVSQGRTSGASAKATLALYLLDGIKVDKNVMDIIQSM